MKFGRVTNFWGFLRRTPLEQVQKVMCLGERLEKYEEIEHRLCVEHFEKYVSVLPSFLIIF